MKWFLYITVLFIFYSCDAQKTEQKIIVDYKISLGTKDVLIVGLHAQIEVFVDSNYYSEIYYNEELISYNNKTSIFRIKDSITPIILKFYDGETDELVFKDSADIKIETINSFPDSYLEFLPCKESCTSKKSILNLQSIKPKWDYKGWDIIPDLREYKISIVRNQKQIDSLDVKVTNDDNLGSKAPGGYRINDNVKLFLANIKIGDVIKISEILVAFPDGSYRKGESKEILIIE